MFFIGLQLPAHLRAVDGIVLHRAGRGTPSLVEAGLALVRSNQLGAAQLYWIAAGDAVVPEAAQLGQAVDDLAGRQPALQIMGAPATGPIRALLEVKSSAPKTSAPAETFHPEPFTEFMVRLEHRSKALEQMAASPNPLVQTLRHFRSITNTVLFPPSSSSSGQALDTAIAIAGVLTEAGHLTVGLSKDILARAAETSPQPLEKVLLDLMSLGQRFNWGQLALLIEQLHDAETLRVLARFAQRGDSVPVIYAAVGLTGNAAGVAQYLTNFHTTGLNDLRLSLVTRAGGMNELLRRNQQLCDARFCGQMAALASSGGMGFVADHAPKSPRVALTVKWMLYLLGGFFIAAAGHFLRRVTPLERPLEVRGFHLARESLFALGFLLVVLLMSEPFLAQGSQKEAPPFRLRLPTVGSVVPAGTSNVAPIIMNQLSFLTMLLFFVLQALLYVASLVKLAEIKRQRVASHMKLKLLDNEDHLFDAGLYLGFLGTIISLILVSLGVFKQPSLMAAYSSTSFGILFVVTFKILHLRGARRQLLLKAEVESGLSVNPPAETSLAAPL